MSKVKDTNFIVVPGWVITDLGLKGNDILIYSLIYGFSQTEDQYFSGSIQYIADWTNSTRQGVIKNLNNLVSLGLIEKVECTPTNKYRAIVPVNKVDSEPVNRVTEVVNRVTEPVNRVYQKGKQSLQNNIDNINNNIDSYNKNKEFIDKVQDIIKYFNSICSTDFKYTSAATRKLIKKHLGEGFTVDDFKRVIDLKYKDWGERPVKFSSGQMSNEYLRPTTLFGDKFESYVYEALTRNVSEGSGDSYSSEIDSERSGVLF